MSSSPDTIDDTIPTESNFSTESYFLSQPPPPGLEARVLEVQKFVDRWATTDKRVVVVTVSWAEQDAKEMNFVDEGKETIFGNSRAVGRRFRSSRIRESVWFSTFPSAFRHLHNQSN
jgi:hypothetical protein